MQVDTRNLRFKVNVGFDDLGPERWSRLKALARRDKRSDSDEFFFLGRWALDMLTDEQEVSDLTPTVLPASSS